MIIRLINICNYRTKKTCPHSSGSTVYNSKKLIIGFNIIVSFNHLGKKDGNNL